MIQFGEATEWIKQSQLKHRQMNLLKQKTSKLMVHKNMKFKSWGMSHKEKKERIR